MAHEPAIACVLGLVPFFITAAILGSNVAELDVNATLLSDSVPTQNCVNLPLFNGCVAAPKLFLV